MRWIRRLTVFALGILLILDSIINNFHVLEFIVGLIMVGLIPVDTIIDATMGYPRDEAEIARIEQIIKKDLSTGVDNSENSPKE